MTTISKLYNYDIKTVKTYLFSLLFIAGNLLLPQIAHLIPNGGLIFLPIYFFTLIAAYKFGPTVGLLTAVFSPLLNNLLFGMPPLVVLPSILIKSIVLAIAASLLAKYFGKVSFWGLLLAVIAYQLVGTVAEWIIVRDLNTALQDFRIGFPGIIIQLIAGFGLLKLIEKR